MTPSDEQITVAVKLIDDWYDSTSAGKKGNTTVGFSMAEWKRLSGAISIIVADRDRLAERCRVLEFELETCKKNGDQ